MALAPLLARITVTALVVSLTRPVISPTRWFGTDAVSGHVRGCFTATGYFKRRAMRITGLGSGASQTDASFAVIRRSAGISHAVVCSVLKALAVLKRCTTRVV